MQQLFSSEELRDRKPSKLLRRLQQLLGDKVIDASFLRELFLQRLPPNVIMVLASTPETTTIDEIATLPDHIMDVSAPSISTVAATQLSTDVDHLRAEIASLRELVLSLSPQIARRKPQSPRHRRSPSTVRHLLVHLTTCAGTMPGLVKQQRNAVVLAPGTKTHRPGADGDQPAWPE